MPTSITSNSPGRNTPSQAGAFAPPSNAGPSNAGRITPLPLASQKLSKKRKATDDLSRQQAAPIEKLKEWQRHVQNMGIAGPGIQAAATKTQALNQHGTARLRDPSISPMGAISEATASDLIRKVAAPNAGDHSPSISSVNRVLSSNVTILGRGAAPVLGAFNVGEKAIPTMQFTTAAFAATDGTHLKDKDSAAHSAYTSLREMHGAGEKSVHPDMDSLLDTTARAFSPYNARGEVDKAGVKLPKVNVHSENKNSPELHKSKQGVDPFIAQQMMNRWYREQKGN